MSFASMRSQSTLLIILLCFFASPPCVSSARPAGTENAHLEANSLLQALPETESDPLDEPQEPGCEGVKLEGALEKLSMDCETALKIQTYFSQYHEHQNTILHYISGPDRIPLTGKEARRAADIFDLMNLNGDAVFDQETENALLEILKLFAGDDKQLHGPEGQIMRSVLSVFNGDAKMSKDLLRRLLALMQQFDSTGLKYFHFRETEQLHAVIIYFAGEDGALADEELKRMEKICLRFGGNQKLLRESNAQWLFSILRMFDSGGDGILTDKEQEYLEETVDYFATGDDEPLDDAAIEFVIRCIKLLDDGSGVLDSDEAEDLLVVMRAFAIHAGGRLRKLEASSLVQFVTMFAGDGKNLMLQERKQMLETVDYFRNGHQENPLPSLQVAKRMIAEISLFDASDDGFLDPDEQTFFLHVARHFGGKKVGFSKKNPDTGRLDSMSGNFITMSKAISEFRGKQEGAHLTKDSARKMIQFLTYFEETSGDGSVGLSEESQEDFATIAKYFGQKLLPMSHEHIVAMEKFLLIFIGKSQAKTLNQEKIRYIVATLNHYDDEQNERLREGEGQTAVETVEYFAATDSAVGKDNFDQMDKVLKWFGEGKIMRVSLHTCGPSSCTCLLKPLLHDFLTLFGNNETRTLDLEHQKMVNEVLDWLHFAKADAEKTIRWLLKIMPHFAHKRNKLTSQEFQGLKKVVSAFGADNANAMESEEVQSLTETIIQLFAGRDEILTPEETSVLLKGIEYFKLQVGNDAERLKFLRLSVRWLSDFLPYFSEVKHELTEEEFQTVKNVCESFEVFASKIMENGEWNDLMMTLIKHFAGPDEVISREEQESLTEVISYFKEPGATFEDSSVVAVLWGGIKWLVGVLPYFEQHRGTITHPQIQTMKKIFKDFDADASFYLDDPKQRILGTAVRYFAGDDELLGSEEETRMVTLVNLFLKDTQKDSDLPMQRDLFLHIMRKFNGDGEKGERPTDYLNDLEQQDFLTVSRYFAGSDGDSDTTATHLSVDRARNLLALMRLFESKVPERLDRFDAIRVMGLLKVMDTSKDGSLNEIEWKRAEPLAQYFAGPDKRMTINAYDRMMRLIDLFDGADNTLDQTSAEVMIGFLASFDLDESHTLDEIEAADALECAKFFAGPDGNLDHDKRGSMLLATHVFSGANEKLDHSEIQELLQTLKLFAPDGMLSGPVRAKAVRIIRELSNWAGSELAQIRTTIAAFAEKDRVLSAEEARRLQVLTEHFDLGNTGKLSLKSLKHFQTTRDYFLGGNKWFEGQQIERMSKVVKHYATCPSEKHGGSGPPSAFLQETLNSTAGHHKDDEDGNADDDGENDPKRTKKRTHHHKHKDNEEDDDAVSEEDDKDAEKKDLSEDKPGDSDDKLAKACFIKMTELLKRNDLDHVGIIDDREQEEVVNALKAA
mmetsp:Transcript_93413/g.166183  ORF Transcript_93413/g.166183 Transcript_93413/m.166183 type:complete len:1410 (+) Transcript_93413:80-4309(+)